MKDRFLILAATLAINAACHAQNMSVDFGTSHASNWLATAGGATNVPAWQLGSHITVTSNAFNSGAFLPGGSVGAFNGFWTANFTFFLPSNASNVSLTYSNLSADDRAVFLLNGHPIDSTGTKTVAGTNAGFMVLTNGGLEVAWDFTGPIGAPAGSTNSGFLFGTTNVLEAIVNNTKTGFAATSLMNISATDGTTFAVSGNVTYSLPPPVLSITLRTGVVMVNWSTNYFGYQLQETTNLLDPNSWSTVTASHGFYTVAVTNQACFFRLRE